MSNRFPADDEHLHPYPGNLKHHKVSKEEQRKLLSEMMADDAKSGLYDTEKRKPLLSNERIVLGHSLGHEMYHPLSGHEVRDFYEAARVKDAELIQRLVDGLQQIADEGHWTPDMHELLNIAAAAGFKPSEP